MNAPQSAAQLAPTTAAQSSTKQPKWLDMSEEDFAAYCKQTKLGGKKVEAMRERRAEFAALADDNSIAQAAEQLAQGAAAAVKRRRTREEVVQSAIAVDKAPEEALRTRYIDPRLIDVKEGWNSRIDFGDLEELAASIKAQKAHDGHGLINDIRVKEKGDGSGRYWLVDGERRLRSVLHLIEDKGEEFAFGIPSKVEPATQTSSDLIIKMFVANAGKPFLPYEEALYYKRLRDGDPENGVKPMTIAQIEAATGRSDNSIVGALALLDSDEDLVEAVIKGEVGATIAKGIAVNARGDRAKQKELTAKAKAATASKDKKALKTVKKEIDDSRRAKAAKKGLKLKMRALDDSELAQLGTNVGLALKELMEAQGIPHDSDMEAWVAADPELAIAATFGALQALKAAAGVKASLEFAKKA